MKSKRYTPADHIFEETELIINPNGSVYHLGVRKEDLATDIIVVGDPERVSMISARFDEVDFKHQNREFATHTGWIGKKRISVLSHGIGVDNIDIVMNELDAAFNIDFETRKTTSQQTSLNILRLGTCGTVREDIEVGSFLVSRFAVGLEGLPYYYAPEFSPNESALMDLVNNSLIGQRNPELSKLYATECSETMRTKFAFDIQQSITVTANGFYAPQGRVLRLPAFGDDYLNVLAKLEFKGVPIANLEMETSGLYALGGMLGHNMLTICCVLANRINKQFSTNPEKSVSSLIDLALRRL